MKRNEINEYIKSNYQKQSDEELSKATGLSENAVRHRRRAMKLHVKKNKIVPASLPALDHKSRMLFLDIETAPSLGWYYDKWKEGNIVATEKSWFVLSFAWKWAGESKIHALALNDYPRYKRDMENDKALMKDLWHLMDAADVIIAHNGDRFDIRKINARLIFHGFNPPSPYKTIDTLKISRRHFMFDSNRLNDVGTYFGIGGKTPHTGFKLWRDCMAGDKKSWELMKEYNKRDIQLLEDVYVRERAWVTGHPNVNLADMKANACPTCGSTRLQRRGYTVSRLSRSQRFQCSVCSAWSTGKTEGRLVLR